MTVFLRVSLVAVLSALLGLYVLADWMRGDLRVHYRKAAEETLVDVANVLAEMVSLHYSEGATLSSDVVRRALSSARDRTLTANIYGFEKSAVDLRVYVTDTTGRVIFDSDKGKDEGKDYSQWRDVARTLRGEYGARTTTEDALPYSTLYVAAPIVRENQLLGVLSVGKPTVKANEFIVDAQREIFRRAVFAFVGALGVALFASYWITRPIKLLMQFAEAVRDGRRARVPRKGPVEVIQLADSLDEMRTSLEGRAHVDRMVRTLAHGLKSPLAAVRGAAELLVEGLPKEDAARFSLTVAQESVRMQDMVEKLVVLSDVTRRQEPESPERFTVDALLTSTLDTARTSAGVKQITLEGGAQVSGEIQGERVLLTEALLNLVQNAIEFSPRGGRVKVSGEVRHNKVTIAVEDEGPGIPEFALGRIFEPLYSLPRPESGVKGSGVGLTITREVINLHGGMLDVRNVKPPGHGVVATMTLPLVSG